jgi:hypothetical protein
MGVLIAEWVMIVMGFLVNCILVLGAILIIISGVERLQRIFRNGT